MLELPGRRVSLLVIKFARVLRLGVADRYMLIKYTIDIFLLVKYIIICYTLKYEENISPYLYFHTLYRVIRSGDYSTEALTHASDAEKYRTPAEDHKR